MTLKTTLLGATLLLLPLTAATVGAEGIAVGAHAGSLGLGADITVRTPAPRVNARVGFNLFKYSYDTEKDDIAYEFDFDLRSLSALLDLHPFGGAFRMSGGLLFNQNKLDGVATPSASYEIGGTDYPAALVGSLTGKMRFKQIAPYAGIGVGNAVREDSHFTFSFDLGMIFQGQPDATLTAHGPIALLPSFQRDLREEEDNLNEDLKNFRFYPVLALGLSYQF